jgi:hypothetical protein
MPADPQELFEARLERQAAVKRLVAQIDAWALSVRLDLERADTPGWGKF